MTIGEHHDVPAVFASFLQFFGIDYAGLRIKANASAWTEPPLSLNRISPIALFCDVDCKAELTAGNAPWPVDDTTPVSFQFTPGDPLNSSFGPVALPGVDAGSFSTYVGCDPTVNGSANCNEQDAESSNSTASACQPADGTAPCWYPRLKLDPDTATNYAILSADLQAAGAFPHLVAIYDEVDQTVPGDPASPYFFHVIGWASYAFTVNDTGAQIQLNGTFHKLFVDGARLSSDGRGGGIYDFGVRALGLSQ